MARKIVTAARFEPSTRTIRSVPENYWLASMDSWDGAVDHDGMGLIFAAAPAMLRALRWAESFVSGFEGDDLQNIDGDLAVIRATIAAALGTPTAGETAPIPAAPEDGPYSPELAEAFRQGARELCNCNLGERIHIDAKARVEECEPGDGGAIVHCTIYVSDGEREALPGDDDDSEPGPWRVLETPCADDGGWRVWNDVEARGQNVRFTSRADAQALADRLNGNACQHCGEERGGGPDTGSLWTCGACNGLNEPRKAPVPANADFERLTMRGDVVTVTIEADGRFAVTDDVGAHCTGDYYQIIEWLERGL